jgi:hypothetical protein
MDSAAQTFPTFIESELTVTWSDPCLSFHIRPDMGEVQSHSDVGTLDRELNLASLAGIFLRYFEGFMPMSLCKKEDSRSKGKK